MCRHRSLRLLLVAVAGLIMFCLGALVISSYMNSRLPDESETIAQLSEGDKGRLREYFHLKETLGNQAWPGWGEADIPVILYNEAYAFLVGYPDPPAGWQTFPGEKQRGGPWEPVPNDTFEGQVYYRQQLPAGLTPEAFTVQVGDRWSASMTTMQWARIALADMLEEQLPPPARPVFPYWLMIQGLMEGSDHHIAAVAHEAFHAFQGISNADKLLAAEAAVAQGQAYPRGAAGFQEAWQTELDLLAGAIEADSDEKRLELAGQFVVARRQRRQEYNLSGQLQFYEQSREWEEGLGKYIELTLWRLGAETDSYDPQLSNDPEFDDYQGYERRWRREVAQLKRMAGDDGDGRFYYSGMAQAVLLDHLLPGWKEQALGNEIYLDELLATAAGQ